MISQQTHTCQNITNDFISTSLGVLDPCIPYIFKFNDFQCKRKYGKAFKYFEDGYGDMDKYQRMLHNVSTAMEKGESLAKQPLQQTDIHWSTTTPQAQARQQPPQQEENKINHSIVMKEGSFTSPATDFLPSEASQCRFIMLQPSSSDSGAQQKPSTSNKNNTFVIILPGSGESTESERFELAKKFVQQRGWSSIIMIAPYYGSRKPAGQESFHLRTVADHFIQSLAICQETAVLCQYLMNQNTNNDNVCITGFSYGGGCALGATSASLCLVGDKNAERLSAAYYCPTVSYEAMVSGDMSYKIDYEAFRSPSDKDMLETKQKLHRVMKNMTMELMMEPLGKHKKAPRIASAIHGAFQGDTIVEPYLSHKFYDVFERDLPCRTEKTMKWFPGGHASAAILRTVYQYDLVLEVVEKMEKLLQERSCDGLRSDIISKRKTKTISLCSGIVHMERQSEKEKMSNLVGCGKSKKARRTHKRVRRTN